MLSVPNGCVVWRGVSDLDHWTQVMTIVTGLVRPSSNSGTGPILQGSTLVADHHPAVAARAALDRSICGGCPLRGTACYVRHDAGVGATYRGVEQGIYAEGLTPLLEGLIRGRVLRNGSAYGDPAAALTPFRRLREMVSCSLAYTHSPASPSGRQLKGLLMASTENVPDTQALQKRGWNTFRIRLPWEKPLTGELDCPKQYGGMRCISCQFCTGEKGSASIVVHGSWSKVLAFGRLRKLTQSQFARLRAWWLKSTSIKEVAQR